MFCSKAGVNKTAACSQINDRGHRNIPSWKLKGNKEHEILGRNGPRRWSCSNRTGQLTSLCGAVPYVMFHVTTVHTVHKLCCCLHCRFSQLSGSRIKLTCMVSGSSGMDAEFLPGGGLAGAIDMRGISHTGRGCIVVLSRQCAFRCRSI